MLNKEVLLEVDSISELSADFVLRHMDKVGEGYSIIVDKEGKLIGLITDGDIRRYLINKDSKDFHSFVNQNPLTHADDGAPRNSLVLLMRRKRITLLPIVDKNNILVNVISLKDVFFEFIDNPVVLMAGGLGSRLRPLTNDLPKPMLPLGDKPIIERLINRLVECGYYNFYITVNYLSDKIVDYFGDGKELGVNIQYVHETKRTGTAGSLFYLKDKINMPFIVMNSDLYVKSLDFRAMLKYHEMNESVATMGVVNKSFQVPFGVIETKSDVITDIKEKPDYEYLINGGVYLLNPEVLNLIENDEFLDMPSLFRALMSKGDKTLKYRIRGGWTDIGTHDEYKRLKNEFEQE